MKSPPSLYNLKTIQKNFLIIKISEKQKEAAKEWLQMLKEEKLEDEVKNYSNFKEIILRDLLGYPEKMVLHAENNVEYSAKDENGKITVCFECKGAKTKDLFARQYREKKEQETPFLQTWTNMGRFPDMLYGVCTNYKDFVLLDQKYRTTKCYKFNFLQTENFIDKLKEFIGIFSYDSLVLNKNKKLVEESINEEKQFTKEFYKLYHETRLMLIEAFKDKNKAEQVEQIEAVHYAQVFLNRLIFIFFAEDKGDIEHRLFTKRIQKILETAQCTEFSKTVCDDILSLFQALDKGSNILKIFGFNGGLFEKPIPAKIYFYDLKDPNFFKRVKQHSKLSKDTQLDEYSAKLVKNLKGKLNLIIKNLLIMDSFDFNTEVNVNILGHIFEQSISDLEDLKKETFSRRKKEGVYYTPEYVTEYICTNTIIPYLSKNNSTTVTELISEYSKNINDLENKLNEIKIIDPACGSGAFLLKAVEILTDIYDAINDFKVSQSYEQKTMDDTLIYRAKVHEIIEKNIFGVDINEEAVEITKLGLFLKIANEGKKLSTLSKNIQKGNSINDDDFDWKKRFESLEKFDIVIGNPPYLKEQDNKEVFRQIKQSPYKEHYQGKMDLWFFFLHRAIDILKEDGKLSFITNSYWIKNAGSKKLIKRIKETLYLSKCIYLDNIKVFEDVSGKHMVHFYSKRETTPADNTIYVHLDQKSFHNHISENNPIIKPYRDVITEDYKIDFQDHPIEFKNCKKLGILVDTSQGFVAAPDKISKKALKRHPNSRFKGGEGVFALTKSEIDSLNLKNESAVLKNYLLPDDIGKYFFNFNDLYIIYSDKEIKNRISKREFPNIKSHLDNVSDFITSSNRPYGLHRPRERYFFEKPKLLCKRMFEEPQFCYDDEAYYVGFSTVVMIEKNPDYKLKYILAILNSKLAKYWFYKNAKIRGGGVDILLETFRKFPIRKISPEQQQSFVEKVDGIMNSTLDYEKTIQKLDDMIYDLYQLNETERNLMI